MPPIVKKGLSVTVLTVVFTGLLTSLLQFIGSSAIDVRDTTKLHAYTIEQDKKYKKVLMKKIDVILESVQSNKIEIAKNHEHSERNKYDLEKCRNRLNAFLSRKGI